MGVEVVAGDEHCFWDLDSYEGWARLAITYKYVLFRWRGGDRIVQAE